MVCLNSQDALGTPTYVAYFQYMFYDVSPEEDVIVIAAFFFWLCLYGKSAIWRHVCVCVCVCVCLGGGGS